ncbi:MAG TPA: hypothetical protein VIM29_06370 [Bacillota bacterium]
MNESKQPYLLLFVGNVQKTKGAALFKRKNCPIPLSCILSVDHVMKVAKIE